MPTRNASLIQHFATSGETIAAVDANDTIHVWSLASYTKLCEVTPFSKAPGIRLALSRDGGTLYAGSWYAGGAIGYSLSEFRELWRRKDLVRFSSITADGWEGGLYCCFDGRASIRLDPATGQTVEKLRGLREIYAGPQEDCYLVGRKHLDIVSKPTITRFTIPRLTFAVLAVAFAPDCVAVSESGGPIRCLSLKTGAENWRHTPESGVHLTDLAFCQSLDLFVGIEWAYKSDGIQRLVSLTRSSGDRAIIGDVAEASDLIFCASGNLLVSSEGDVVEVNSGRVLRRLDFPREDYEEPDFPSREERLRTGTPEQRELARLLG
jgi:hypothetical protein